MAFSWSWLIMGRDPSWSTIEGTIARKNLALVSGARLPGRRPGELQDTFRFPGFPLEAQAQVHAKTRREKPGASRRPTTRITGSMTDVEVRGRPLVLFDQRCRGLANAAGAQDLGIVSRGLGWCVDVGAPLGTTDRNGTSVSPGGSRTEDLAGLWFWDRTG